MRPLLQTTLHRTLKKFNEIGSGNGNTNLNEVASKLLSDLTMGSSSDGKSSPLVGPQDSMEAVLRKVFDSKTDMLAAQGWVIRNNTDKLVNQPSFKEFYTDLLVASQCTCDEWDSDPCRFHDVCEHGIRDLAWGIKEILEGDFAGRSGAVPACVRMVGTAALASTRAVSTKQAEVAAANAADDSKEKPDKAPTLAEFIGQSGSFLLAPAKTADPDAERELNEALLQSMISSKAHYLLQAMSTIIHAGHSSKLVHFSDVPRPQALVSLLSWLCTTKPGLTYLVEVESRFQFLVTSSNLETTPGEDWGGLWARILAQALSKEAKESESIKRRANGGGDDKGQGQGPTDMDISGDVTDFKEIDWKKFLAPAAKVVKGKTLLASASEAADVKDEENKDKEKEPVSGDVTAASPYTSFPDIYTMHEIPEAKNINSMDVIAVGQEIQTYLLRKAASPHG